MTYFLLFQPHPCCPHFPQALIEEQLRDRGEEEEEKKNRYHRTHQSHYAEKHSSAKSSNCENFVFWVSAGAYFTSSLLGYVISNEKIISGNVFMKKTEPAISGLPLDWFMGGLDKAWTEVDLKWPTWQFLNCKRKEVTAIRSLTF